ncbi:MAG: hypothetical protein R6U57_01905 [Anaerolineales bacterium]
MFKEIRWKTFPRDFLVAQVGFILFGLAIALIIKASLGTGAWGVLVVALAECLGSSPGMMVILTGVVALGVALLLGEEAGWGTVANMLFIGPWLDFFLLFIPVVEDNLPLQVAMLLGSIAIIGLASPIYIGVNAGAGPRDSLMLGVSRICGWSVRLSRVSIELVILSIGWLLDGPVGVGTLVFALLVGPSVQLGFRLLRVQPHRSEPEPVAEI